MGGVGFVFAHDAEGLAAATLAQDGHRRAELYLGGADRLGLHLRAVAAGGPVAQFASGACGGLPVVSGKGGCLGGAVAFDFRLDQRKATLADEVRKRRNLPFGQFHAVVRVSLLGESLAHAPENRAAAGRRPTPYPVLAAPGEMAPIGLVQS